MPEKSPDSRDTNPNAVSEQTPHSGVEGYERPVFNFNGKDLQAALDSGELHIEYDENGKPKVIVPDTIGDHVDPTKSETTEVYRPLTAPVETSETLVTTTTRESSRKRRGIAAIAAGAVATAVLGSFGAVKMFSGEDNSAEPRVEPSASASPNPGEGSPAPEPSVDASPETSPSPEAPSNVEVIASVEQYPTAADAIIPLVAQIDAYKNYYGTTENLTSIPYSEEQKAEHEAMLQSVFGPNLDKPELSGLITNLREAWSEVNGYKSLTQQSIDQGYDTQLFEIGSEIMEIIPTNDYRIQFVLDNYANFDGNNIEENMSPEYAEAIEANLKVTATLEQVDGAWYISEWYTERL